MKELSILKIEVLHENCWTHHLQSPDLTSIKVMPLFRNRDETKRATQTYVVAKGSRDQLDYMARSESFYDFHPVIFGVLGKSKKQTVALMRFEFRDSNSIFNLREDRLFFKDVLYRNNHEVWYLMGTAKFITKSRQEILEKIEEIGKVVRSDIVSGDNLINSFFSRSMGFYLSDSQTSTLMQLYDLGFFNFPRDLSIEQASDTLDITKGYISKLVRNVQKTMIGGYRNDALPDFES